MPPNTAMRVVRRRRQSVRGLVSVLALTTLLASQAAAHTWHRNSTGKVVGSPPKTPAQLLDFCVANPAHCSISINHLSGGWQRHLEADRLNAIASTYKVVTLLDYAQRVADRRIDSSQRLSRDHWTRFWVGADGEELQRTPTGPVLDADGGTYRVRRIDGRRVSGSLRRSWEYLRRPIRITVADLADVMMRFSDNAAADWFLHEFGDRSVERLIHQHLIGYHDTPPSINAMFLTYFLNPDQPGRPAIGERMLSAYSGYAARGYLDEVARWVARLEDRDYVSQARSCQPAVLPWDQRIGACPPSVGEPGEKQMRQLFNRHSVQSNTRTQTRLMTHLLERTLLDPTAHKVAEGALEYRLDSRKFRSPSYRNLFRRHGAKSGSFGTNIGLSVLTWTAYFETQPGADGTTNKGAVSIHLRDLPGRQPDGKGGYATPDIDFDLPLRFAEGVILNRDALATAVANRLPADVPRAKLVQRVRRLEARRSGAKRTLTIQAQIRNIGTAATQTTREVALYLRTRAGAPSDGKAEPADQRHPVPPLAPGESIDVLFGIAVPEEHEFFSLAIDPGARTTESTGKGHRDAHDDVHWEHLHFPTVNYRSIGTRRSILDAGDGRRRGATGIAGSTSIRFVGDGELPGSIGRGDQLVLAPGGANEMIGHVASREGRAHLTLQQPLVVSLSNVPFTFRRAFHDIQSWESTRQGDLVADERVEVGIIYDDGTFVCRQVADSGCAFEGDRPTTLATIDGSVTNAAHYMALEVADGQRHRGIFGSGPILDGERVAKHGIRILDHYTRISGLTLRGFAGHTGAAAISIERARHVLLTNLLIHDFDDTGERASGILGSRLSSFTLRNSIIADGNTGVRIGRPSASALVQNCTVFGMSGIGFREGDGLLDVHNSISMGNGGEGFQVRRGIQDHNLSSDGTASGSGSMTDRIPTRQFRSLAAGARDLHLRAGADAVGAGIVLHPAFRADIDGEPRPVGESASWNMGADQ